MKKTLLILLSFVAVALTSTAQVVLNSTNFPDANLRSELAAKFSISEGDVITAEQIASTDALNVKQKGIADMTGVGYFTELTELEFSDNAVTAVDLSKNTKLQLLACWGNKLTTIDVSGMPELYYLDIEQNNISTIDLSNNPDLTLLYVSENPLKTIDLSKLEALEGINGYGCNFEHLDFSHNPALNELYLEDNNFSEGEMDALVVSLPDRSSASSAGKISVFDTDEDDRNVCNTNTIAKAKAKNWDVIYWNGDDYVDYDGTAPTGIQVIDNEQLTTGNAAARYNLGGQRVGKTYQGIVIENGKKRIRR